jgi:hypothetical protein
MLRERGLVGTPIAHSHDTCTEEALRFPGQPDEDEIQTNHLISGRDFWKGLAMYGSREIEVMTFQELEGMADSYRFDLLELKNRCDLFECFFRNGNATLAEHFRPLFEISFFLVKDKYYKQADSSRFQLSEESLWRELEQAGKGML